MPRQPQPLRVSLTPKPYGAWSSAEEREAFFAALRAEKAEKQKALRDA